MSQRVPVVMGFVSVCLLGAQAQERNKPVDHKTDPSYALVWADEFDHPGAPDPNRWAYEKGFVRNRELQWYQPENARCENGVLVIEARRERKQNLRYVAGSRTWA